MRNQFILILFMTFLVYGRLGGAAEIIEVNEICLGFDSPSLLVTIHDSLTEEIIETANVHLHYVGASGNINALFDKQKLIYFSTLPGYNGDKLGIVVETDSYQTFLNKDLGFVEDTSCGAKNEWSLTVHLCPLGKQCKQKIDNN